MSLRNYSLTHSRSHISLYAYSWLHQNPCVRTFLGTRPVSLKITYDINLRSIIRLPISGLHVTIVHSFADIAVQIVLLTSLGGAAWHANWPLLKAVPCHC